MDFQKISSAPQESFSAPPHAGWVPACASMTIWIWPGSLSVAFRHCCEHSPAALRGGVNMYLVADCAGSEDANIDGGLPYLVANPPK
jgi:hypothetical protein